MIISTNQSDVFKGWKKRPINFRRPYALDQATFEKIVLLVFEKNTLNEDGMMVIEHSKYTKLDHMIQFSFKKVMVPIFSFFWVS
jgi:hypothetical protein